MSTDTEMKETLRQLLARWTFCVNGLVHQGFSKEDAEKAVADYFTKEFSLKKE